jgi:transcriptional regulator with XRE-family HTH domain
MVKRPRCDFGRMISARRRELGLTQGDLSRLVGTSAGYIAHLENAIRLPSDRVLNKLAFVLELDTRELLLQARPTLAKFLKPDAAESRRTAWEAFARDKALQRSHSITAKEMQFLSQVATLGEVKEPRDFIFILIAIRFAIVDRYPGTERPMQSTRPIGSSRRA